MVSDSKSIVATPRNGPANILDVLCFWNKTLAVASVALLGTKAVNIAIAATLTVTTSVDNGAGSLRQAIQQAASGDTINFSVTGTITLTNELLISSDLTIAGPGINQLSLDGNGSARIFEIASNAIVAIAQLTITNGLVHGTDAYSSPDYDGKPAFGGAVFNAGGLTMSNCNIVGNSCLGGSSYIPSSGANGGNGDGGAIWNSGTLKLFDCTFSNNLARGGSGAAGSGYFGPTFPGGVGGEGAGGAIYNAGAISANNCTFFENRVVGGPGGGAGASAGNRFAPGGAGGAGGGGTIAHVGASTLRITNCTFNANSAQGGEGGPGFANNRGGYGGNGSGGNLLVNYGTARCVNLTVWRNSVIAGAGGTGGYRYPTDPVCPNCPYDPVPGSASGGGIHNQAAAELRNTVLANYGSDFAGTVASQGGNLVSITNGSSGWLVNDLKGGAATPLDPKLGPLTNNGGLTLTVALLPGSPAIDTGTSSDLTTDQRGRLRPVDNPAIVNAAGGDGTDIGAFELQSQPTTLALRQMASSNLSIRFLTEVGQKYRLERKDSLAAGPWSTLADNIDGTGEVVETIDPVGILQPSRFYRVLSGP